jgi:4-hydroxybenzoate polyprenyltransferase
MYALRFFYFDLANLSLNSGVNTTLEKVDFFILVFSTILIAAAGNIINDYFDVKADKINRPERLIISKFIKPRYAIVSHWVLNGIAFTMAVYLSARYHTFWYVFVHLISINTLWFYSMYFKKKVIIGNFLVASLTGLVPILCGIHFATIGSLADADHTVIADAPLWISALAKNGIFIFGMAFFAFILNFSREIIKDIQDVEGDKKIHAKTFAIVYGTKKSFLLASLILGILPITLLTLYFTKAKFLISDFIFFVPLLLAICISSIIPFFYFKGIKKEDLKQIDKLLKLAMLLGIILPFYWFFLL